MDHNFRDFQNPPAPPPSMPHALTLVPWRNAKANSLPPPIVLLILDILGFKCANNVGLKLLTHLNSQI